MIQGFQSKSDFDNQTMVFGKDDIKQGIYEN